MVSPRFRNRSASGPSERPRNQVHHGACVSRDEAAGIQCRGNGDYLSSHDLGDFIAVVDGRSQILEECRQSPKELTDYLGRSLSAFLTAPSFLDALGGHLPPDSASQERLPELEARLRAIAQLFSG